MVAIYDWRIALRVTVPLTLIIASLVGLNLYQTNYEKQQGKAPRSAQERQERKEEIALHNSPAEIQRRKQEAEMGQQRIEQAEEQRKTAIKSFFASNRSLIQVYFNSASLCHSGLMFRGKMEDNEHCQTAIEAKDKLQQITESLVGISKEELEKEDSTTMWRIEYAENQMEYADQLSRHRK